MDQSQLPRTYGHHYESTNLADNPSGLTSGVEGHSEGHQGKPSVLKKVKAKAKKIKNTLTKRGHDHDHDNEYDHEHDHDEDEEDEVDEDPELHGAPIYDSPPAGGTNLDRPLLGPHYDTPIGDSKTRPFVEWQAEQERGKNPLKEDKHAPLPSKPVGARTGVDVYPRSPHQDINRRTGRDILEEKENPNQVGAREAMDGKSGVIGTTPGTGGKEAGGITPIIQSFNKMGINRTEKDINDDKEIADQVGGPKAMEGIRGGIGTTTGFDEDPQGPNMRAHPSHAQVKTIDPAGRGSEEAEGITPVIRSFNKMGLSEEKAKPKAKPEQGERLHTGSHDQFSFEPMPHESSDSVPKSYNADNPRDMPGDINDPARQSSTYTGKITSASATAASSIADKAQSAKNVVGSKIEQVRKPGEGMPRESSDSDPKSYNAANPQDVNDPARQSSTYTEKITSASATAASSIANTAQSAKNVIASKIQQMREPAEGTQMREPAEGTQMREQGEGTKSGTSVLGTASDYAQRMASTVTGTLAPVYGKVVGVGSTASSKVSGLGAETAHESGGSVGQDKGVPVKGNWVEKLQPGEEDKALSAMITESFGKPKGERMEEVPRGSGGGGGILQKVSDVVYKRQPDDSEDRKPMGKVTESEGVPRGSGGGGGGSILQKVSDAVYKRQPEESEDRKPIGKATESEGKKMEEVPRGSGGGGGILQKVSDVVYKRQPDESENQKPMGKVTESEEVAKRLGTGEEGTGLENLGSGGGVVTRLTGAIGSWLGGQGGVAKSTPGTTLAGEDEGDKGKNANNPPSVAGERRLQESSN